MNKKKNNDFSHIANSLHRKLFKNYRPRNHSHCRIFNYFCQWRFNLVVDRGNLPSLSRKQLYEKFTNPGFVPNWRSANYYRNSIQNVARA